MDPAGTTKVMQAVVTPKGGMVKEVADVSSFTPTTFRTYFSSMIFRRIAGPGISGIPRPMYVYLLSHLYLFPQCFSQMDRRIRDPKANVRPSFLIFLYLFPQCFSQMESRTRDPKPNVRLSSFSSFSLSISLMVLSLRWNAGPGISDRMYVLSFSSFFLSNLLS